MTRAKWTGGRGGTSDRTSALKPRVQIPVPRKERERGCEREREREREANVFEVPRGMGLQC
jgi:hypothetical protein